VEIVGLDSITEVLTTLAKQRPLFHSEADFQHAFAWEIHKRLPGASVRLERPIPRSGKLLHVDIWVTEADTTIAIELKYKTRSLSINIANERFALLNQGAQDLGRHDFIKDIQRLENIGADPPHATGYAVLLTNDRSYWSQQRSINPVDSAFRLHEGRELHGAVGWGAAASAGTKRGREAVLQISGTYPLRWSTYSEPYSGDRGIFRYLIVQVKAN
jgi:hypothetical protein